MFILSFRSSQKLYLITFSYLKCKQSNLRNQWNFYLTLFSNILNVILWMPNFDALFFFCLFVLRAMRITSTGLQNWKTLIKKICCSSRFKPVSPIIGKQHCLIDKENLNSFAFIATLIKKSCLKHLFNVIFVFSSLDSKVMTQFTVTIKW